MLGKLLLGETETRAATAGGLERVLSDVERRPPLTGERVEAGEMLSVRTGHIHGGVGDHTHTLRHAASGGIGMCPRAAQ